MKSRTRHGIAGAFYILMQLCGALMWFTYVAIWVRWQGDFGFFIGIVTVPGIVIFPVMFFLAEHRWPIGYCVLWLITLLFWVASFVSYGEEV